MQNIGQKIYIGYVVPLGVLILEQLEWDHHLMYGMLFHQTHKGVGFDSHITLLWINVLWANIGNRTDAACFAPPLKLTPHPCHLLTPPWSVEHVTNHSTQFITRVHQFVFSVSIICFQNILIHNCVENAEYSIDLVLKWIVGPSCQDNLQSCSNNHLLCKHFVHRP